MKVLYIGGLRSDAEAVATALREIARTVSVSWTTRPDQASRWIDQNPDLSLVVAEPQTDPAGWRLVLRQARALASHPIVVVVKPEGAAQQFASVEVEADETLTKTPSLPKDLLMVVRARTADATSESAAAAERQAHLETLIGIERAARADAEQKLADAKIALDISVARASANWEMLDEQLRKAAIEVEQCRRDEAAAVASAERMAHRETELTSQLAEATATRLNLEQRIADAQSEIEAATARSERERRELEEKIGGLETRTAQEIEKRTAVEEALARTAVEGEDEAKRHASAIAEAAARSSELETAVGVAQQELASRLAEIERRTQHEAELTSTLADATTRHTDLERRLAATEAAFQDADARATRERLAAARKAADREAELESRIKQEQISARELVDRRTRIERELTETVAARDDLARRLIDAEISRDQARRDHQSATADVDHLTKREADLTSQLADARAAHETAGRRLADALNAIADTDARATSERAAAADRETDLEIRLTEAVEAREKLETTLAEAREAAVSLEQRTAGTEDLNRRLTTERDALRNSSSAVEDQFRRLEVQHRDACERFANDRAAADADIQRLRDERAETERLLADARKDLQDAFESQQGAEATRRALQATFEETLAARDREVTQLQGKLTAATQAHEAMERRLKDMQAEADQLSQLRRQLEDSRAESHRLFHLAPIPMFRCTRDGALTEANRAWTTLVRRKPDEQHGSDFAAAVLESPNDLSWLIERCLSTRAKESIETTVRRKDGARLFVRLSACASKSDVIEIAAEDLTRLRVLQDRLGQSHRMEAVGRVASEVALACGALLNDVRQHAQQWLVDAGANGGSRQQGELLLQDLNRAADSLLKLVAYSDKQVRTPTLVELNALMRDLAPVLKHVAGDDVEIQLPNASAPLNVDVETERVERLLVNLAAYGRERMPFGGSLTIELGTSVVDHRFTAKYPNVRPGPHALITVTENRRPARADGLLQLRDGASARAAAAKPAQKPAMDLGTLQGLVGQCGGHLWMRLQPLGDIVAKIRLPLVTSYDQSQARTAAAGGGARSLTRWFHI